MPDYVVLHSGELELGLSDSTWSTFRPGDLLINVGAALLGGTRRTNGLVGHIHNFGLLRIHMKPARYSSCRYAV